MKRTKLTALLLSLFILVSIAGCKAPAETTTPTPEDTAISVTDMTGREITLETPAEKIVALTPSDCEILYAVGAGDKLVGRGEYCNYPEAVLEIPSVQSGSDTNIEQIIALEPDVVIMSSMAQTEEQVATMETAGITVVVSEAKDIEGVYTAIGLIGAIVGRDAEAAVVIDSMKNAFTEISEKVTGDGSQTVYFEVTPLEWGLWTAGTGTFMEELATMLGLTNIFSDVEGWGEISQEQVIDRNPDFIVSIAMYYGDGPDPVDEIMGRDGWQDITAIKNGAVLHADSDEIARPGPRLAEAADTLYTFIYGES